MSEYAWKFGRSGKDCVSIIADKCPNLTHLNLSRVNFTNSNLVKLFKSCSKLCDINLAYCTKVTDATIARLFQYCTQIEKVDLTFCHILTGFCFERVPLSLKSLVLDQCESLKDEYLLLLFSNCKNLTYLSLKRNTQCAPQILKFMIHNSPKLNSLYLAGSGFDSLSFYEDLEKEIKFEKMENLTNLDLSACNNSDSKLIALILTSCRALKCLDVSNSLKLTDEIFTLSASSIKTPLEELSLSFLNKLTDESLKILSQSVISTTLKTLRIKNCWKMSNQAIINCLTQFPNLKFLDVRLNTQITNLLLETALTIDDRKFYIQCTDTNVDVNKFVFDHDSTAKQQLDRELYLYEFKNLKFEALQPKKLKPNSRETMEIWQDNGFYYIGSPLNSDEEDLDNYTTNNYGNYDYYDEDDDDPDAELEDFLNNDEQEMFDEMGQFY
jgi:hypothetical protein